MSEISKTEKPLTNAELKARILELETKLASDKKETEEAALDRVCKAVGIDPKTLSAKTEKAAPEDLVKMDVPIEVRVNMTKYLGVVTVPLSTARVIQQAIGDRRMRLLRELTGNDYVLRQIEGGGFAPHIVGQVGLDGEHILFGKKGA